MQVTQILGHTIRLSLLRTRIPFRQPLIPIQPTPRGKPPIISTERLDGILALRVQLGLEVVRTRIDVVLDGIRALAVRIVIAGDLHQTRGGSAGVGVAAGFLHGDDGEDGRVDGVLGSGALEVLVVLGAGGADAAVELVEGEVDYVREGEVGRCLTVAGDAGV